MKAGLHAPKHFPVGKLLAKLSIFGSLVSEIVNTNLCMSCGACVASCPVDVLYMAHEEKPVIKGPCALCQVCYYACPRVELPVAEIEEKIFGRSRRPDEEMLGIYKNAYSARATDPKIRARGQDGGAVTAILAFGVENKLIDASVLEGYGETDSHFILGHGPLKTVPVIASSKEELLKAATSKYTPGGAISGLGEAGAMYPDGRIAVVALPCEAQGLQRMHSAWMATPKYGGPGVEESGREVITIGLFCCNIFDYEHLTKEYLIEKHKIEPDRVTKIDIKKNILKVYYENQEKPVFERHISEVSDYIRPACKVCNDYTAELADISVGSDGSPPGWATILTRSEKGDRLVQKAIEAGAIEVKPLSEVEPGITKIMKLSSRKKQRPAKYIPLKAVAAPFAQ